MGRYVAGIVDGLVTYIPNPSNTPHQTNIQMLIKYNCIFVGRKWGLKLHLGTQGLLGSSHMRHDAHGALGECYPGRLASGISYLERERGVRRATFWLFPIPTPMGPLRRQGSVANLPIFGPPRRQR